MDYLLKTGTLVWTPSKCTHRNIIGNEKAYADIILYFIYLLQDHLICLCLWCLIIFMKVVFGLQSKRTKPEPSRFKRISFRKITEKFENFALVGRQREVQLKRA